jgi:CheY-like chemotaxis protein
MLPTAESERCKFARGASERGAQKKRLRGVSILVAEDDADSRRLLMEVLCSEGATCVATCSGAEAFEAFNRKRPDVLIADVWMPDWDGFELIRRIRALAPEQGGLVPAIAISGGANAEQALMAGYHVLLAKPFDIGHLVNLVDEFVPAGASAPVSLGAWTMASSNPGHILLTYKGYVRASDARGSMMALVSHLQGDGLVRITADLRGVTGFALVGAYVAQRIVWPHRDAIAHVRIITEPSLASITASSACRVLGIGCTVDRW